MYKYSGTTKTKCYFLKWVEKTNSFYNLLKRSGCTFRNGFSVKIALGFVRFGQTTRSEQVKKVAYVGVIQRASEASEAGTFPSTFTLETKKEETSDYQLFNIPLHDDLYVLLLFIIIYLFSLSKQQILKFI